MLVPTPTISRAADADPGAHPLDRPIWSALTTRQAALAEGNARARRYPAEIAPFADTVDASPASIAALGQLIPRADRAAIFSLDPIALPAELELLAVGSADQMVGTSIPVPAGTAGPTPLGGADVPDMLALVELTKPGPFGIRTHELGRYLGIRAGNRLVAMAGERMKLDGFTEISAVCTHPDYRGRGYARVLLAALSHAVRARGELPFLHVFSDNASAIALYRTSGFTLRRTLHVTVMRRAS